MEGTKCKGNIIIHLPCYARGRAELTIDMRGEKIMKRERSGS